MIAIQHVAPNPIACPPVLISLIGFVLRPIAPIAMTIKNFESVLRLSKITVSIPKPLTIVVTIEANKK